MYTANAYSVYKNQDLETSKPDELISKMMGTAAVSLKRAVIAIGAKKLEMANSDIIKAETIVKVLDDSLDMQYPVSEQLRSLYQYMMRRLTQANLKKDCDILNEVSDMLTDLRDTWNEAMKSYKLNNIKETG